LLHLLSCYHFIIVSSRHLIFLIPTSLFQYLNPGPTNFTVCTLNIRSVLTDSHSAALSGLTVSHHPDLICLTETWIKPTTTLTELAITLITHSVTFCETRQIKLELTLAVHGTGFLIREPFKQLPTSLPQFISFESSSITLKLAHSVLPVFNSYRPPLSSRSSKPFSVFLDEFNSFLSIAATTPHEFLITGDFNIHLDNPTDYYTSQFLSLLSSFNLLQHVNFPTHNKNHILDLIITSSDSSLAHVLHIIQPLPYFHYTFCWPHTSFSSHFSFFSSPSLH